MKKVVLFSTILLSTVVFASQAVNAADPSNKTTGDVTFTTGGEEDNKGGSPFNPGEVGPKIGTEGDGSFTNGPLRFEWISNIHFGDQKISSADQNYPAIWNKSLVGEGTDVEKFVPFVQVTDETGNPAQTWTVKVSMTDDDKFKNEDNQKLENTYIEIYNVLRTNKVHHGDNYSNALDGLKIETFLADALPSPKRINSTGVELLQTKAPGSTNGTRSNVIFAKDSDFDRENGLMRADAATVNTALKLNTPSRDVKIQGKEYKAALTWELINAN